MHPTQPTDHAGPVAPTASWVMGRSARWQTPEGQALLAQDPLRDDIADLRLLGVAMTVVPGVPIALRTIWRAVRLLCTAWVLRRGSGSG